MATITAAMVKELRQATSVSMMECKNALVQSDGDMEQAMRMLRERGIAMAGKRAHRAAKQGLVASAATEDGNMASLVEVNCETDFVARNEDFKAFVAEAAQRALETDESLAEVMKTELTEKIAATGENMVLRRNCRFIKEQTGAIGSYIHLGGKVGVLVELGCEKEATTANPAFAELLKDLTLHVAASAPQYLTPEQVPAETIAAEREIFAKQVEGKPENIIEKIVDGKISKFYQDICFVKQGFVKEPKQSIDELLAETGKAVEDTLTIRRYKRYMLGE